MTFRTGHMTVAKGHMTPRVRALLAHNTRIATSRNPIVQGINNVRL